MKKLIIFTLLALLFALNSCKPTQLIIHDVEYRDKLKHDSIYIEKNKIVTITHKGDSVFVDRWNTEYKYINRYQTDSVYKYKEKPIYITTEVSKYLSTKKNWYDAIFIIIGKWISGLFLIIIIYMAIKYFNDIKKYFKNKFPTNKLTPK